MGICYVACHDAPLLPTPTVTFCSVHLHNEVAKKRDASTSLLQRLREHMILHSVDFIGGDFNISASSTVGDVFPDPEFAGPGNALLWSIGGMDETCRDCTGFIIMPQHPHTWMVQLHGCYEFDNADLCFGPSLLLLLAQNVHGPRVTSDT